MKLRTLLLVVVAMLMATADWFPAHGVIVVRRGYYGGYYGRPYGYYGRPYGYYGYYGRPYARTVWIPGHYVWRNGYRIWIPGHWR